MFLLPIRTSVLALLIGLVLGLVTMVTAEDGLTCRQEIPSELIRNLWSRTKQLIDKLPKEENFSRRMRLLPKFCTNCPEKLKEPEIGKRPLFGSLIKSIDTSCQKKEQVQLMNLTLDIYAHIFSSILQHNHQQPNDNNGSPALLEQLSEHSRPQVELDLTKLQQKMENLRKRLNKMHHQQPNHEDVLSQLQKIKVDDPLDQKKALAEFNEVYQAACVITSHRCGSSH
ncbi:hypothetical protein EXN66_Car021009 [Channa argus]|uniref:Uncharacterized protein n=1 Tax=Channa argus TaxID=215402 RepID=A0A6G1QSX7_CHAAH|nr:hypothetical protein EXN66_Car021009 [Channa argus]